LLALADFTATVPPPHAGSRTDARFPAADSRTWINRKRGSTEENLPLIERKLLVAKWVGATPSVELCALCSQEFKVPKNALKRMVDVQASLQGQSDSHKCEPEDASQGAARGSADVLLRKEPVEDEEEDDRRKQDDEDDDETDDGYSE
jgi:hypothetical protein